MDGLFVPSLKPIRFRGVSLPLEFAGEAGLHPTDLGDTVGEAGQLADGMKRHLRIVRTSLHGEISAAALRDELIAGELGQIHERGGALRREAVAIIAILDEQAGTETESECQPGRWQAERVTAVGRWDGDVLRDRFGRLAASHPGRGSSPRLQHLDDIVTICGEEIECHKVGVALQGRYYTALMLAPEGLGSAGFISTAVRFRLKTGTRALRGDASSRGGHQAAAEKSAAREPLLLVVGLAHGVAFINVFTSSST